MDNKIKLLPLVMITQGKTVTIKEINGGYRVKKRLTDLGLIKNANIKLINNEYGPIIVRHNETKIALGFGMAQKIMVEELN